MEITDVVLICKVLSDETRLKIVQLLMKQTLCACDLLAYFHCTQPTLSYHMKQLTQVNLVLAKKEGQWMKYSLNKEVYGLFQKFIVEVGGE